MTALIKLAMHYYIANEHIFNLFFLDRHKMFSYYILLLLSTYVENAANNHHFPHYMPKSAH